MKTHAEKVQELVARITKLRASMPQSMWEAMQRRVCAQVSVSVATDALLKLQDRSTKGGQQ
jgi:hypothetical protein